MFSLHFLLIKLNATILCHTIGFGKFQVLTLSLSLVYHTTNAARSAHVTCHYSCGALPHVDRLFATSNLGEFTNRIHPVRQRHAAHRTADGEDIGFNLNMTLYLFQNVVAVMVIKILRLVAAMSGCG